MLRCPECNSDGLIKFGTKFARDARSDKRRLVQQYQCKNCGRITIKPRQSLPKRSGTLTSEGHGSPISKVAKEVRRKE